jgi:hypothetical protein
MLLQFRNLLIISGLLLAYGSALAGEIPLGEIRSSSTLVELLGAESARHLESVVDPDETIEWELYVPENYDPDTPAGLVVYVSPMDSGAIPGRWKSVMDDNNLIWIGANHSGNRVKAARRVSFALFAPVVAAGTYKIDESRVYLSGFSGGGRVASIIAPEYSHIFGGAIYICGVNFWGKRKPKQMEEVRENRYVFVTGRKDFNRTETRDVHRMYRRAGVNNVLLMDISGMDHTIPSAAKFAEAIIFLDDEATAQGEEESQ